MEDSADIVLTSASPGPTPLVSLLGSEKLRSRKFLLRVQVGNLVSGPGGGTAAVVITPRVVTRGVSMVRGPLQVAPGPMRPFRYSGGAVIVTASLINPYTGGAAPANSSGEISAVLSDEDDLGGAMADAYNWVQGTPLGLGGIGVQGGQIWTGPGVAGQGHVTLATATNVPTWVLLFDSVGAPTAGAAPIPGGVSDGLSGTVGSSVDFEDEFGPGTVAFQKGLYVALSTDPTQYALPAGGTARFDFKVGQ